jgi:hypothetical protein
VVDVGKHPTGYNDLRMYFYIFFGLASVVSLLSLLSKRAIYTPYHLKPCPLVPVPPSWISTFRWPALERIENLIRHFRSRTNSVLATNSE